MLQCATHTTTMPCPTCGCTCSSEQGAVSIGEFIGGDILEMLQIRRMFEPRQIDLSFLRPAMISVEPWLEEQQRTPRRMKRPFPPSKPAPSRAYRRPCY